MAGNRARYCSRKLGDGPNIDGGWDTAVPVDVAAGVACTGVAWKGGTGPWFAPPRSVTRLPAGSSPPSGVVAAGWAGVAPRGERQGMLGRSTEPRLCLAPLSIERLVYLPSSSLDAGK